MLLHVAAGTCRGATTAAVTSVAAVASTTPAAARGSIADNMSGAVLMNALECLRLSRPRVRDAKEIGPHMRLGAKETWRK